jgi:hypothetical protein
MSENNHQVITLMANVRLFHGLDDEQMRKVAAFTQLVQLNKGEILHQEGADNSLYIIVSGKVRFNFTGKADTETKYVLKQGDFIGADVIFRGRNKPYHLEALEQTLFLCLQVQDLRSLLNTTPQLTKNIKKQVSWYNLVHSKLFSWLGEEETVKTICRKHPAYLIILELAPLAVAWIGIFLILFASFLSTTSFRLALGWFGTGVAGGAVVWAVWRFFDWRNDYYIVTDERIVWLEHTVGIYDSRQEAPLVAIKAGETKSSQVGRWLGYGDVITQTFMGQVFFRHVGNPGQIKDVIDQERRQAIQRQMSEDIHTIEGKIRQKIEPSQAATAPSLANAPTQQVSTVTSNREETKNIPEKLSFWAALLARFQTRREANGVITYRKHLYVLFRMTWLPAACVLALVFGTGIIYYWRLNDQISLLTPGSILFLGILLLSASILWWLYMFTDWSNDIYRITSEKIIDSERKPLGDEITKSASLENIIGLDYERLGILGVVLNFGNVIINIGTDNKFIFYGIHNPARAQRDIFNYMYAYRRRKQQTDTLQEQERVSNYFAAYHRQVEDMRQTAKKPPQI